MKHKVKEKLKVLVPKLFRLVDCDHLNWNKIEGKFQQVFDERDYSLSQTKASFIAGVNNHIDTADMEGFPVIVTSGFFTAQIIAGRP